MIIIYILWYLYDALTDCKEYPGTCATNHGSTVLRCPMFILFFKYFYFLNKNSVF